MGNATTNGDRALRKETKELIDSLTREIDIHLFSAQAKAEGNSYDWEYYAKRERYAAEEKIRRLDFLLTDYDKAGTSMGAS